MRDDDKMAQNIVSQNYVPKMRWQVTGASQQKEELGQRRQGGCVGRLIAMKHVRLVCRARVLSIHVARRARELVQ